MKTIKLIKCAVLLALTVCLYGCASTKTVSYTQLRTLSLAHHGDSFPDTTFYCGSEDGYDFFYIEYGAPTYDLGRKYRLLESDSPIKKRFERSSHQRDWVKVTLYSATP